ncbi:DUF262 domain-containing protein [Micrococcus luteus]|uniref:DUF262 domain-containing protein n=1 Tax=Micrococcus luteus TaxID=1270 RepID=UPI00254BCFCA|nr:DUF262 domain-containing protein [Micrococcus luteus]MDK7870725.1 DUF262 domain-containing protein [Micrococcus luteus]MDK8526781.1 DUF262 domain-containing protein [Micrococcus luteus]MDK8730080.1 DUF262 domain-containing protein [Micrococcus luteus]
MDGSTPQTYTIADVIKWQEDGELTLNPDFQRGSVWSSPAKSYLIDSILRGYPIPKILIRTSVDRNTRRTKRDVVDGQQRLRTIISFALDEFILGNKAGEFQGSRYADLEPDLQDAFLAYKLTLEQLINASDEDVLEVFARLNSNAVPVNAPEKRNAAYTNDFSALIQGIAKLQRSNLAKSGVSDREFVRLVHHSIIAELVGYLLQGVGDGGESSIDALYKRHATTAAEALPAPEQVGSYVERAVEIYGELNGEKISSRPHFLILIAALMHIDGVLPHGRLEVSTDNQHSYVTDIGDVRASLAKLNYALADEDFAEQNALEAFREARNTTQRMKSRNIRFNTFLRALRGEI